MQEAMAIQGSGWCWLVYNVDTELLEIKTTSNQALISDVGDNLVPLLNVDMWEHSYYVDYENRKKEYLEKIWRIINWEAAEERFRMQYVARKVNPEDYLK